MSKGDLFETIAREVVETCCRSWLRDFFPNASTQALGQMMVNQEHQIPIIAQRMRIVHNGALEAAATLTGHIFERSVDRGLLEEICDEIRGMKVGQP